MKKQRISVLLILTFIYAAFLVGFQIGRKQGGNVIVSVPQEMQTMPAITETVRLPTEPETEPVSFPININTADQETLMHLPGIGEVLAKRILAYREAAGGFDRVTDLLNVDGIGNTRMEELLDYVTTGGEK